MTPFVSAIMVTRDRREFVSGAVECFLSQDWPALELIVIDDGDDLVEDLMPDSAAYFHIDRERTIGYKRNLACEAARGEYIVHWDDDDWSGPRRISEQVRYLVQTEAPATGYNMLPFAADDLRRAWLYRGAPGYACGTSLCYRRSAWRARRFPNVQIGEDNAFIDSLDGRLLSYSAGSIVARVHAGGTSGGTAPGIEARPVSRLELLTSTAWTGEPGQAWLEIEYAQLAECGYPVKQTYDEARELRRDDSDAVSGSRSVRNNRSRRASVPTLS